MADNKITIIIDASTRAAQSAIDSLSSAIKNNSKAIDAQSGVIKNHNDAINNAAASSRKLSAELSNIGISAGVAAASLALPISNIIKQTAAYEQNEVAISSMLKSTEKGQKLLGELSQFAARTPFELKDVVTASKQLLAYGVSAQDVIPSLTMLGNAASGVGTEKLPNLILAFGQVQAKGRLMGEELRQISETGIPLLEQLSKNFGVTKEAIQKMASEGKISAADFQKALAELTTGSGQFAGMMEAQSKTLGGAWSNITDQIGIASVRLGNQFKPQMMALEKVILNLVTSLANVDPVVVQFFGTIAAGGTTLLAIVATVALVASGISKLQIAFELLNMSVGTAIKNMLLFAISPVGLTIIAIGTALAATSFALNAFGKDWSWLADEVAIGVESIAKRLVALKTLVTKGMDAYASEIENIDKNRDQERRRAEADLKERNAAKKRADEELRKATEAQAKAMAEFLKRTDEQVASSAKKTTATKAELRQREKAEIEAFSSWQYDLVRMNTETRVTLAKSESSRLLSNQLKFGVDFATQNDAFLAGINESFRISNSDIISGSEVMLNDLSKKFKDNEIELLGVKITGANARVKTEEAAAADTRKAWKQSFDDAYDLGSRFAKDFKGTLNDLFDKALTDKDTGIVTGITKSISSAFNLAAGPAGFISGGLGALISGGVSAIINGIFGGTGKSVAEYAEESFDRMVKNTNKALGKIGQKISLQESQIEALVAASKLQKEGVKARISEGTQREIFGRVVTGDTGTFEDLILQLQNTLTADFKQKAEISAKEFEGLRQLDVAGSKFKTAYAEVTKALKEVGPGFAFQQENVKAALSEFSDSVAKLSDFDIDPIARTRFEAAVKDNALLAAEWHEELLGIIDANKKFIDQKQPEIERFNEGYLKLLESAYRSAAEAAAIQEKNRIASEQTGATTTQVPPPMPQFANGLDGSQLEPLIGRFSPGEIVIPKDFSRLITQGKMQLSAPSASDRGPSTVNITIQGGSKSGEQTAREVLPYLKPYLNDQFLRSSRGNFGGRF